MVRTEWTIITLFLLKEYKVYFKIMHSTALSLHFSVLSIFHLFALSNYTFAKHPLTIYESTSFYVRGSFPTIDFSPLSLFHVHLENSASQLSSLLFCVSECLFPFGSLHFVPGVFISTINYRC